jgi:hypothetical protein
VKSEAGLEIEMGEGEKKCRRQHREKKIAKILTFKQAREQAKQARENKKSEKMAEEVKAADRT